MSKFEESNFYKALQDFFINADKKTFLQFLAEFYNRTEGIIAKDNIQDDLIKELRELYLEFNENGIDENIVRQKVDYFLENSLKIKNILAKLVINTNKIEYISSQLDSKANKNEVGTPLTATNISEMIDTTKIYVNTTDGNWYSWNGSDWVSGGVYNSQGIADKSITENKTSFINVSVGVNKFDKEIAEIGKYQKNETSVMEDPLYYMVKVDVKEGDILRVTYNPNLATNPCHVFNKNGERIGYKATLTDYQVTDNTYWSASMPAGSSYIIINGQVNKINSNMIIINNDYPASYVPFDSSKKLNDDIQVPLALNNKNEIDKLKNNNHNVLYGKKAVFCGDSVTYGHSAEMDDEGVRKTYQYYIGKRNNMNIITNAISGSTITNIDGKNPFSVDRYKNLGDNLDYILLWFGINDSEHATLGTIKDTDNTTFYGAWNIVLEYLITNYPTTKIGIVVTYNGGTNFREAVRLIAKKWAIPTLDWMGDANVPMISGRESGFGLSDVAKNIRRNTFLVDGVHPNDKGYQYISTVVENFLRSL